MGNGKPRPAPIPIKATPMVPVVGNALHHGGLNVGPAIATTPRHQSGDTNAEQHGDLRIKSVNGGRNADTGAKR